MTVWKLLENKLNEADIASAFDDRVLQHKKADAVHVKPKIQVALTKRNEVRLIDSFGRVLVNLPMKLLKKLGGPSVEAVFKKELPLVESMGSGNSTSHGDGGGESDEEIDLAGAEY